MESPNPSGKWRARGETLALPRQTFVPNTRTGGSESVFKATLCSLSSSKFYFQHHVYNSLTCNRQTCTRLACYRTIYYDFGCLPSALSQEHACQTPCSATLLFLYFSPPPPPTSSLVCLAPQPSQTYRDYMS